MPIAVTNVSAVTAYGNPIIGKAGMLKHIKVDLSGLTSDEVDADGYLKPGVVLKESAGLGILVGGTAAPIFVVPEATKLNVVTPTTTTTLSSETGDHMIGVAGAGLVNRDVAEDNMGRAYTANELTSFVTAGTHLAITTT